MLITIGKRIVYTIIICIALLFIALGSMWCLSSHYKLYGVPVLNYHQVNDKYHSALTLDVAQFKKQMEYLHNEGYHTISLDDLYAYVTEGKELPDKPIVLTFDDGYIDNYPSKLDDEIKGGKDTLQAFMGKPIDYLAYPGGFNNAEIQRITSESGYKMAFTVTPGTVKPGQNLYALPRLAIFQGDTPYLSFWMRLHCAPFITYTWQLRDTFRDNGFTKLASLIPLF